jgi:hypothetical protein
MPSPAKDGGVNQIGTDDGGWGAELGPSSDLEDSFHMAEVQVNLDKVGNSGCSLLPSNLPSKIVGQLLTVVCFNLIETN